MIQEPPYYLHFRQGRAEPRVATGDAALPLADGGYFCVGPTIEATQAELARFSKRDAERLPLYYQTLDRAADVVREMLLETPPNVGGDWGDFLSALKTGKP